MEAKKVIQWVILATAVVAVGIWDYLTLLSLLGATVFIIIGSFILSYTEIGPFTQLPNNRALRVRRGKNIVMYYVNGQKLAISSAGKITLDDGTYQKNLRSGPLGLIFRWFGMVWTGIPGIGGIIGMQVTESELDFTQNPDGSVTTKTVRKTTYYSAPPIFIRRAISFGGIPIEGNNLVDFGIATTLRISNLEDVGTKLTDEGSFTALKGSLESALRPEVEVLKFDAVLKIRSEFRKKDNWTDQNSIAHRVITITDENMEHYGYGLIIHDLDIPMISPSDREYAVAVRKKDLYIAEAEANTVKFSNDALKIETLGAATAKARKALMDASGDKSMALLAEAMGAVQPGATVVMGNGVVPTIPVGDKPNTHRR